MIHVRNLLSATRRRYTSDIYCCCLVPAMLFYSTFPLGRVVRKRNNNVFFLVACSVNSRKYTELGAY